MKINEEEHDVIWLQSKGVDATDIDMFPDSEPGDITWCSDSIYNTDTKYLLATPEREAAEATQKALKKAMDELGVPNKNYPAPVSNAYGILKATLAQTKEKKTE